MALSKKKIIEEIENGTIWVGFDDKRKADVNELEFDTVSLDLHLNRGFKIWKIPVPGEITSVDPSASDFDHRQYAEKCTEDGLTERDGSFLLESHKFVICTTFEWIKTPKKYFARVEGRSSLARLGLTIHNTAPTIQADWGGRITLEIYNHSPIPVRLKPGSSPEEPGLKIAQLIFEEIIGDLEPRKQTFSSNQESALGRSTRKKKS